MDLEIEIMVETRIRGMWFAHALIRGLKVVERVANWLLRWSVRIEYRLGERGKWLGKWMRARDW